MNDLVSVIVPVYNAESYLKRCVESLLAQTYKNFEVILVDDGSTDNSFELCNDYSKTFDNVIAVHKENGGVSETRNFGLSLAKGTYISFVDSDDCVDERMLEVCISAINKNSADMVGFDWQGFSGEAVPIAISKDKIKFLTQKKILPYFLINNHLYCAVRYFYKKEILENNAISFDKNIRSGEDQLFIYKYIAHCKIVNIVSYNGYFYFKNMSSASAGVVKAIHYNDLAVRNYILSDCRLKKRAKAHLMKGYLAFCLSAIKYGTTCEEDIISNYRKIIKKNLTFILFSRFIDFKRKAAALSVAISLKLSKKLVNKTNI